MSYLKSVFINAPFDAQFRKLFDAIVFTIVDCGFIARCALEEDNGAQVRLEKIYGIIENCKLAVHDISRTQLDTANRLPRFNMPLELGVFLGAKRFGNAKHASKNCLILDREPFRYQKFISDLAGQDPRAHANDPEEAIKAVRNWLLHEQADVEVPSAKLIAARYGQFKSELPALSRARKWDARHLLFKEKVTLMAEWIRETPVA